MSELSAFQVKRLVRTKGTRFYAKRIDGAEKKLSKAQVLRALKSYEDFEWLDCEVFETENGVKVVL